MKQLRKYCYKQLNQPLLSFLSVNLLRYILKYVHPLRSLGPQFLVARGKYHLVEVCETEVPVFVMAVEADQIGHVLLLNLVFEIVL